MHSNNTNDLLQLKGVKVQKIIHTDTTIHMFIQSKPRIHNCPCCGNQTSRVHDYRTQKIKHVSLAYKPIVLHLKKRRYVCSCGKRFYEDYDFISKYRRISSLLEKTILHECSKPMSFTTVAQGTNVSLTTVIKKFDQISYPKPSRLPEVLCIDEFRGNSGGQKFQCILVDGKKHRIVDILKSRNTYYLADYFSQYTRHERSRVKFFVCDMWTPYVELAKTYFPNATVITDKYHFARQVTWAMDGVRRRLQNKMEPSRRKLYKRSKSLLLCPNSKVPDEKRDEFNLMLLYSEDMRIAYNLKEAFNRIAHEKSYAQQRTNFLAWIRSAIESKIPEFIKVAKTFSNWGKYILNAYKHRYSNGVTEGFNNKIKVIKRVSYGFRNFRRFRNVILHTCR